MSKVDPDGLADTYGPDRLTTAIVTLDALIAKVEAGTYKTKKTYLLSDFRYLREILSNERAERRLPW